MGSPAPAFSYLLWPPETTFDVGVRCCCCPVLDAPRRLDGPDPWGAVPDRLFTAGEGWRHEEGLGEFAILVICVRRVEVGRPPDVPLQHDRQLISCWLRVAAECLLDDPRGRRRRNSFLARMDWAPHPLRPRCARMLNRTRLNLASNLRVPWLVGGEAADFAPPTHAAANPRSPEIRF